MKTKSNKKWSLIITFILVLILFSFISFKLFSVQYSDTSITYTHDPKFEILDAKRGSILSEDGRILSVYMPVYDVRLDLVTIDSVLFEKEIENLSKQLHQLFKDRSASKYEKDLLDNKDERYFLLKRDVSYMQLHKMKTFPIFNQGKNKGGFIPEIKSARIYPFGSLAKVTIGRVYIEDDSIIPKNGIEFAFNQYLQGIPGKQLTQEISGKVLVPKKSDYNVLPQPGKDVITTINIEFQDAAEVALKKKLKETHAEWGCVILMEVETGDIKAIANLHRGKDNLYYDSKNHAIVSAIVPGSTFKLASFISILDDSYLKLSDTVDTDDGKINFYGSTISDTKDGGYGKLAFGDAFVVSSNVAISKVINENYKDQPYKFYSNLQKYYLTEPLELQLPFRSSMIVRKPGDKLWSGTTLPSMSYGYEMHISPIQILTFYNAIANNGKMVSPRFVTAIKDKTGIIESFPTTVLSNKICSERTIQSIIPYMEQVVSNQRENWTTDVINGTAKNIYTEQYSIAGKTGTIKNEFWKWSEKTKYNRTYTASFAGFFPVEKPKYSCIVVIHEFIDTTNENHYGGQVAAPVFREISDKVFAFDSELEYLSTQSYISDEKIDRVTSERLENSIKLNQNTSTLIKSDLNKGIMPNLKGMQLRDVIPVFENYNLKIEFEGAGKVIFQSVNKGDRIDNQEVIKIRLS
ncbi:MAG: transpeptidase family protein [Flavobacteriales bacterium]|nr:transpeptidase family protein [Flavobacteriales bacterium]